MNGIFLFVEWTRREAYGQIFEISLLKGLDIPFKSLSDNGSILRQICGAVILKPLPKGLSDTCKAIGRTSSVYFNAQNNLRDSER